MLVISDSVSESPKRLQPLISKRLGMSYCHGAEKQVLFSLLKRTNEKAGGMGSSSCVSSLMTRVLSLGKSSHDSCSSQVPFMTISFWLSQSSEVSRKCIAPIPRWMRVNSGKSIPSRLLPRTTHQLNVLTIAERNVFKPKSLQHRQVYSSIQLPLCTLQYNV